MSTIKPKMNTQRINRSSGAPWEDALGYSRAVQIGSTIEISGTAPIKDGKPFEGSAYEQTVRCLEIIKETLESLGAVVRTRMFTTDISQWEAIGKAHGEFFKQIKPAATMVEVSRLIDERMLVEIEATAIRSGRI